MSLTLSTPCLQSCPLLRVNIIINNNNNNSKTKMHKLAGDGKIYLHRELKRRCMKNSCDLRGSRRLSILCDFICKVFAH